MAMLYLVGILPLSLILTAILVARAPEGYEDSRGFHYGRTPAERPPR
jgi:hypothetical protein